MPHIHEEDNKIITIGVILQLKDWAKKVDGFRFAWFVLLLLLRLLFIQNQKLKQEFEPSMHWLAAKKITGKMTSLFFV